MTRKRFNSKHPERAIDGKADVLGGFAFASTKSNAVIRISEEVDPERAWHVDQAIARVKAKRTAREAKLA